MLERNETQPPWAWAPSRRLATAGARALKLTPRSELVSRAERLLLLDLVFLFISVCQYNDLHALTDQP